MSAWNKTAKIRQKTPRERHQPASRASLGLLEKKKDYKLRARDFQNKQTAIRNLKRKALNRNPDEFYFHMINSELNEEGHQVEKRKPLSEDTIEQKKLMESRTLTYVGMKRNIERKRVEKLQSELHLVEAAGQLNEHVRFDETQPPETKRENEDVPNIPISDSEIKKLNRKRKGRYLELVRRLHRAKQLSLIQEKMEVAKSLKQKSSFRPKCVKPGTKTEAPIYKWKYERKK